MSDSDTVRHTAADGSVYAVEVVPPERDGYGEQYGVDLVRASTDRYGLEHEQRLRLGAYSSWGSAEEHQREVETALEKDGLDGLGEDARRVAQMPYLDGQYVAMVFPTDGSTGDSAKVHLLHLSGEQVTAALVADGHTEDMENLCGQLDRAWVEGGNERLLTAAQHEAEVRGQVAPGTSLFDAVPHRELSDDLPFTFGEGMQPYDAQGIGHAHHVDGGGTAHWFAVVENAEPEAEPYELRYFRALETGDGTLKHDTYPVMPLPDDDPGSAWPLPGLEMYLAKGDLYMAQQFAHDVADHHGQAFPDPLDLPALNPEPEYYFGYGVGPNNEPSLEAVKTWMHGSERRFDTFTIAEYGMWDEAQTDERELKETLKTQGLEAALNQAERMAVAGGYLDPNRADGRVFFEDDAPPDPFTTERTRAMERDMQHEEMQQDPAYWQADPERSVLPGVENPYWRLDSIPVNDPEGEPLGHALHMVVYPGVERDPDAVGSPALAADEPFRMLEMAHFETTEAVDAFGKEFNGYLVPGLLDGPELAVEVARLEALPVEWKTLEGDDLKAYQNSELTLTRDPADWHPYNPNAERDARIAAEGLDSDPMQPVMTFNEAERDLLPAAPDIDR
jgi:hypothetical protein